MKHEFKKISQGDVTRYVLEDGSTTVAGDVASVPMALGAVRKRLGQEESKEKEAPKPRNFVAKNAKMGGAGAHKDKKKEEKQGIVKHKKPFAENQQRWDDEGGDEVDVEYDDQRVEYQYKGWQFIENANDYYSGEAWLVEPNGTKTWYSWKKDDEHGITKYYDKQGNHRFNLSATDEGESTKQWLKAYASDWELTWRSQPNPPRLHEQGVEEDSQLGELSKDTLKSYVPKRLNRAKDEISTDPDKQNIEKARRATKQDVPRAMSKLKDPTYGKQGVAEGKADYNFDIEDLKRLEKIRDLPTLKVQALALISKSSAKPMKPEKVEWFKNALENMNSPIRVIKLMYDLLLSGEGHAVVGSRSSMNPNSYRQRFGEEADGGEEYNDEVGMADSNIHTIIRSAKELINTLEPMENMPEWAQEKLAQVKGMLVTVKDYIESQHEHGNIYHTNEGLGDDFAQFMKDKGIKHRVHGTPDQERERTANMMAQRHKSHAGAPSAPSKSGAYRDGFNDGLRGHRNPRASSIYGPQSNDYDSGYHDGVMKKEKGVEEKAPPGWKGTVKAMKKHKDIDNPFALAWSMKNKGYKSHKPNVGEDAYLESLFVQLQERIKK